MLAGSLLDTCLAHVQTPPEPGSEKDHAQREVADISVHLAKLVGTLRRHELTATLALGCGEEKLYTANQNITKATTAKQRQIVAKLKEADDCRLFNFAIIGDGTCRVSPRWTAERTLHFTANIGKLTFSKCCKVGLRWQPFLCLRMRQVSCLVKGNFFLFSSRNRTALADKVKSQNSQLGRRLMFYIFQLILAHSTPDHNVCMRTTPFSPPPSSACSNSRERSKRTY